MTRSDLLEVVYRFYPRGVLEGTDEYEDTVERHRQWEAARRGVAEYPTWKAMISRLGDLYPLTDHSLCLLSGSYDPAYSAHVEIPGYVIGFHVSVLGPYYGIHRTGAPGEVPAALDLAREIETTYPGYQPIPPELGDEEVRDVVSLGMPVLRKVTIYYCLLSELWEGSSGPWPPPTDTSPYEPPADPGAGNAPPIGAVIQRRR